MNITSPLIKFVSLQEHITQQISNADTLHQLYHLKRLLDVCVGLYTFDVLVGSFAAFLALHEGNYLFAAVAVLLRLGRFRLTRQLVDTESNTGSNDNRHEDGDNNKGEDARSAPPVIEERMGRNRGANNQGEASESTGDQNEYLNEVRNDGKATGKSKHLTGGWRPLINGDYVDGENAAHNKRETGPSTQEHPDGGAAAFINNHTTFGIIGQINRNDGKCLTDAGNDDVGGNAIPSHERLSRFDANETDNMGSHISDDYSCQSSPGNAGEKSNVAFSTENCCNKSSIATNDTENESNPRCDDKGSNSDDTTQVIHPLKTRDKEAIKQQVRKVDCKDRHAADEGSKYTEQSGTPFKKPKNKRNCKRSKGKKDKEGDNQGNDSNKNAEKYYEYLQHKSKKANKENTSSRNSVDGESDLDTEESNVGSQNNRKTFPTFKFSSLSESPGKALHSLGILSRTTIVTSTLGTYISTAGIMSATSFASQSGGDQDISCRMSRLLGPVASLSSNKNACSSSGSQPT
ncbi:hypothetical protein BD408DRAFT_443231 [Parasitella parasitica]|nr:hypothetical protein BD408DRAFT_443231 [Parasitella parasitica]